MLRADGLVLMNTGRLGTPIIIELGVHDYPKIRSGAICAVAERTSSFDVLQIAQQLGDIRPGNTAMSAPFHICRFPPKCSSAAYSNGLHKKSELVELIRARCRIGSAAEAAAKVIPDFCANFIQITDAAPPGWSCAGTSKGDVSGDSRGIQIQNQQGAAGRNAGKTSWRM